MSADGHKITVLFVDDDIYDLHEATKKSSKIMTLTRNGDIEVAVALTGSAALEYLEHNKPDVIVLDIMMLPGPRLEKEDVKRGYETGFVVLRKIREELKLKTPVIVLTIYPIPLSDKEREALQVAAYLPKPWAMDELATLIRHLCGKGAKR